MSCLGELAANMNDGPKGARLIVRRIAYNKKVIYMSAVRLSALLVEALNWKALARRQCHV